jgi:hypothetical protein
MELQNAYAERNKVVAAIAQMINKMSWVAPMRVGIAKHQGIDEWEHDWRNVLVIEVPEGQITWHFHDSEMYLLKNLPVIDDYKYDGHSTEEKYKRLFKFVGLKLEI